MFVSSRSYPASNARGPYIVICVCSGSFFLHYLINGTIFGKKNVI